MASLSQASPSKQEFRMPMPPPPLHTRNSHDSPRTPNGNNAFVSPIQTPQGSPSKQQMPPGAHDLPNVFENAMRLVPTAGNPSRTAKDVGSPTRPPRIPLAEDKGTNFGASVIVDKSLPMPGSPNKENAPPPPRFDQGLQHTSAAAASRREPYVSRQPEPPPVKSVARGLSADALERLQKPSVKRLANVTQLYFLDYYFDLLSYVHNRQGRMSQFESQNPAPPTTPQPEYDAALNKYLGRERAHLRKRRTRLREGDFQILTQVGQGGYGQVFLAQKKDSKEVCALKVMSKKLLFKMDEIRHVLTERDILTNAKSDWLVRLLYSFQDERSIYLAMEYVPGGDFRTLLNNTGVLHNRHARFYIAEMFASVDALHQLGYIHRDLKPENFLIDGTGHIKLTDFGLASGMLVPAKIESMRHRLEQVGETHVPFSAPTTQRTVAERQQGYRSLRERDQNWAKSIVGSPDYMAPEVLKNSGKGSYDFTVDYWSLGCMLFEALSGYPPFAGATVEETWQNLKHWEQVFKKPVYEDPNYFLSTRTWSLICKCITTAERRFRSFDEIKAHAYFREVNFADLRHPERGEKAPFIPELDSETDAGYFDDFGSEKDMAKYKEVHDKQKQLEDLADRGEKMNKSLFVGFTFRHRKPGPMAGKEGMESLKEEDADSGFGTMF